MKGEWQLRGQNYSTLVPKELESADDNQLIKYIASVHQCETSQIFLQNPKFEECQEGSINGPWVDRLLVRYEYWYE
jgi:hypothetical protein